MIRRTSLVLIALASASGCQSYGRPSAAADYSARQDALDAAAAAEIRALEAAWSTALLERNFVLLERIVAPEFVVATTLDGATDLTARHKWIAGIRAIQFREYHAKVTDVILAGDTAVATIEGRWLVVLPGFDAPREDRFYVTDTWARRNGQWQVIFRHSGPPIKR